MENISPTLLLLLEVRSALESGTSVRTGIHRFLKLNAGDFAGVVSTWLLKLDQNQDLQGLLTSLNSCQRTLLVLLERGLKGSPILTHLIELEVEIARFCEAELDEQIQKLPFKLMLPVLFLMFPAYLILLLGPVLLSIIKQLGGS